MALQQNTAEGGTDGVAPTTGNSGGASGTAWGTVSVSGTGTSILYDNGPPTPPEGAMQYKYTTTSGGIAYLAHPSFSAATVLAWRGYLNFSQLPATGIGIVLRLRSTATANRLTMYVTNEGGILITDSGGTTVHNSEGVYDLALDTDYRVEFTMTSSTLTLRVYLGHSTTAAYSPAGISGTFSSVGNVWNGKVTTTERWTGTWDAIAVDDGATTLIGPVSAGSLTNRVYHNGAWKNETGRRIYNGTTWVAVTATRKLA